MSHFIYLLQNTSESYTHTAHELYTITEIIIGLNSVCLPLCCLDNPRQISRVPVYIRVLDVNDNAPTFATEYETFVCENAKANQVGMITVWLSWFHVFFFVLFPPAQIVISSPLREFVHLSRVLI